MSPIAASKWMRLTEESVNADAVDATTVGGGDTRTSSALLTPLSCED